MALTLAEAKELRDAYRDAYIGFARGGQSYTIGSRTYNRGQLTEVKAEFYRLDAIVTGMESGRGAGVRIFRVLLRDL